MCAILVDATFSYRPLIAPLDIAIAHLGGISPTLRKTALHSNIVDKIPNFTCYWDIGGGPFFSRIWIFSLIVFDLTCKILDVVSDCYLNKFIKKSDILYCHTWMSLIYIINHSGVSYLWCFDIGMFSINPRYILMCENSSVVICSPRIISIRDGF